MDFAGIAGGVMAVIRPFLKDLVSRGENIVADAGEQAADSAEGLARRIWQKLFPKLQKDRPDAIRAAEDVAAKDDEEAASSLRYQLKKLLEENPEIAEELAQILEEGNKAGVVADVIIHGGVKAETGGIAAGRDIHGGARTGPERRGGE